MKIYFSAGEPSGNDLSRSLIMALKNAGYQDAKFIGMGDETMQDLGFEQRFNSKDIAVMGLWPVIKALPRIRRRIKDMKQDIIAEDPDLVVMVDAQSFSYRLAKKLRKDGYEGKIILYAAPKVWASRSGRTTDYAQVFDGLLCLFDFEQQLFTEAGLNTHFVGHRLSALAPLEQESKSFTDEPHILLLPGSRKSEVKKLWPILIKAAKDLRGKYPKATFATITVPGRDDLLKIIKANAPDWVDIIEDQDEKYPQMQKANLGLHASGTVALELAMHNVPMVTVYKVSKLMEVIVRHIVKINVPYVSLVNLFAHFAAYGDKIDYVPELLQGDCTSARIVTEALALLKDPSRQDNLLKHTRESLLPPGGLTSPQAQVQAVQSFLLAQS